MIQANLLTTFYGVGQGLFCSNQINFVCPKDKKRYPFSFIYDCGMFTGRTLLETLLKTRVNEFWKSQEYVLGSQNIVNLFVLSHFHFDHYSGLKYLLRGNKKIEVVIIPYLKPLERLLVALEEWLILSGMVPDDNLLESVNFILNPEDFFKDKVSLLILLESNDKFESLNGDIEEIMGERDFNRDFISEVKRYLNINGNENGKIIIRTSPLSIRRYDLWKLDFFYPKDEVLAEKMEEFEKLLGEKICKELYKKVPKGVCEKLYKEENLIINQVKRIKTKIREKKVSFVFEFKDKDYPQVSINLDDLVKGAEAVLQKAKIYSRWRNHASIVCCHFPINLGKIKSYVCEGIGNGIFIGIFKDFEVMIKKEIGKICGNAMAQLYTGDIPFDLLKKVMNVLDKKGYCLFQVPHHGSGGGYWNSQMPNQIKSWYWIISAGIRNVYGHPSSDVIRDICSYWRIPIWVNESMNFSLKTIVEWGIKS